MCANAWWARACCPEGEFPLSRINITNSSSSDGRYHALLVYLRIIALNLRYTARGILLINAIFSMRCCISDDRSDVIANARGCLVVLSVLVVHRAIGREPLRPHEFLHLTS